MPRNPAGTPGDRLWAFLSHLLRQCDRRCDGSRPGGDTLERLTPRRSPASAGPGGAWPRTVSQTSHVSQMLHEQGDPRIVRPRSRVPTAAVSRWCPVRPRTRGDSPRTAVRRWARPRGGRRRTEAGHPGTARGRGDARGGRPRGRVVPGRRLRRRGRLLRHLRLPHHLADAPRVEARGPDLAGPLLRPPGHAPAARLHAGRHGDAGRVVAVPGPAAVRGVRQGRHRLRLVRRQLPAGRLGHRLLQHGRAAVAVPALLVAGGGRAVLPDLAHPADRGAEDLPAPRPAGDPAAGPGRRVLRREPAPHRDVAVLGLLRLSGPHLGAGGRRPAGAGGAPAGRHPAPGRRGPQLGRPGRHRLRGGGLRRPHRLPRPQRRDPRARRGRRAGRRRGGRPVRRGPGAVAAARRVGRRRLLRLVPVALAAHRHRARRPPASASTRARCG